MVSATSFSHATLWVCFVLFGFIALSHAGAMSLAVFHSVWARRLCTRAEFDSPISCLMPVSATDQFFERGLASLMTQTVEDFEIILCSDQSDPSLMTKLTQFADTNKNVDYVTAPERMFRNPKISNLVPALQRARHPVVLIKDANIVFKPDQLAELKACLREDVGLVCALPIAQEPRSAAAWVELAMMNGRDAPFTVAASVLNIPVGYGKVMLFRRHDLERIGGLAALGDVFGDDHALALGMARLQLKTIYAPRAVSQPLGARSWRDVFDRQIRWMLIRRMQEPVAFFSEPLMTSPLHVILAVISAPLLGIAPWQGAVFAICLRYGCEAILMMMCGWWPGWRYLPASLLRDTIIWINWPRALLAQNVRWAGRKFSSARE